ncbi:CotS family spore coat protein [Haloimpatiens lingqiaonensis]|uniref:CotS family spore coat protein n=1 Tax=Haloimpatiens lingqiaonensis TaxID=1380675 RepID=UPI0010FF0651|nr:CotS family spore coat protein [Haloimpatiens lingqiaonensis]
MLESEITDILKRYYGILPESIEKIKNVYKIMSKGNCYCFKIIKYNFEHFLFIISAMMHLQNNGFNKIPEFIPTKEGEYYVKIKEVHGYLTPWIESRKCNYEKKEDIEIATIKLAELHLKSRGFKVTYNMKPRIGWLRWIKTYNTRRDEILDFKRRICQKENKTEFDSMYLKIMNEEVKRAEKAINALKNSEYIEVMKEHMKNGEFCHHDFAHHNVLITDDKKVYIIDFDYCMLDTHLHDLSSIMIRIMKNGKWSLEKAKFILECYSSINIVEKRDIPIIAAFMEFPQAYWQLGIQYYWEKQPWGEEFFINKLQGISADREAREEFIENFRSTKSIFI